MKNWLPFLIFSIYSISAFSQFIDGGYGHSIILCEDSTVATFGENNSAQLGIGTKDSGTHPNPNSPIGITQKVKMVSASDYSSYILLLDGTVMAWGQGIYGQIGDGTNTNFVYTPTPVLNLDSVIVIESNSAGDFVLAIRTNGTVWAWGHNGSGQLGIGNKIDQNLPQQVIGLDSIVDVAAGAGHCLALRSDGTVWAWGSNSYGQITLADSVSDSTLPFIIDTLFGATNVEAGAAFSLVLSGDSTIWAFGYNYYGQLGINSTIFKTNIPTKVFQLDSVIDIMCGREHALAIRRDGTSWGWGEAGYNQIGVSTLDRNKPFRTNAIAQFVTMNAGSWHSFATDIYGNLYSFGRNTYGHLGTGSTSGSGSVVFPNYNSLICKVVVEPINPYARLLVNQEGNPNAYRFQDTSVYSTYRLWDFNDGSPIDTSINPLHEFNAPGIYNVCLYAFNQFGIDTTCTTIEILATNINELNSSVFQVYPNPVKDILNIKMNQHLSKSIEIEIFDVNGKIVVKDVKSNLSNQISIPLDGLKNGFYILKLNGSEFSQSIHFVKTDE
ncbi:MAG: T9SS type A sorting domain-containing protein [Flavobacteriales bacterium]|nr:T9SS type A sorting domain-containing protein [Flavobacteriales bacterium]MCB9334857.1 T9SS type A sorting domain-containing protein [Flavobacteriales bacterium]